MYVFLWFQFKYSSIDGAPISLTRQLKHTNDNDLNIYEALHQIYRDVNLVILHMSYKCFIKKNLFTNCICFVLLIWNAMHWLLGLTLSSQHWSVGLYIEFFLSFPPLRRRETYVPKKKRKWRKKRRRPHVGIVKRSGKNAFPPHRILLNPVTWPVVGTYGSWGFFVTTINPPGISWQCPFDDRKLLEADWTKSCVLIMKGVAGSLWTAMSHSITVGNKILKCLPRYESKFVRKTDG